MSKEDQKSNKKKITLSIVVIFLAVDLIVLLIFLLHYCSKSNITVETSSSNIEPSTSEPLSSSIESSSTSEYDPYIDVVISNIKKYVKEASLKKIGTEVSIKDIYSFNTYVESESTHLIYGFTYVEQDNKYMRLEIDLEQELDVEEVISLIHEDNISIDLFFNHNDYDIVNIDITAKDGFKDVYPGSYTRHISYSDEYGDCYMSGIGKNDNTYISVDYLSFDKDTYDVDNTDTHMNSISDINKRYYQLLERSFN